MTLFWRSPRLQGNLRPDPRRRDHPRRVARDLCAPSATTDALTSSEGPAEGAWPACLCLSPSRQPHRRAAGTNRPLAGHHRLLLCASDIAATQPSLDSAARLAPTVLVRDRARYQRGPWRALSTAPPRRASWAGGRPTGGLIAEEEVVMSEVWPGVGTLRGNPLRRRVLATSLYDDPAAELHEDASARLREQLPLPGCSIFRPLLARRPP